MIGNVDFGSISNSSSAQTGYEDFTNISINVSQGSAYTVTITPSWAKKV
jgi:spore coat protein U-like protein